MTERGGDSKLGLPIDDRQCVSEGREGLACFLHPLSTFLHVTASTLTKMNNVFW